MMHKSLNDCDIANCAICDNAHMNDAYQIIAHLNDAQMSDLQSIIDKIIIFDAKLNMIAYDQDAHLMRMMHIMIDDAHDDYWAYCDRRGILRDILQS